MNDAIEQSLSDLVIERVVFGIFLLDHGMKVLIWNRFMRDHGGLAGERVVGKSVLVNCPKLAHDRPITDSIGLIRQDCTFVPLIRGREVVAFVWRFPMRRALGECSAQLRSHKVRQPPV